MKGQIGRDKGEGRVWLCRTGVGVSGVSVPVFRVILSRAFPGQLVLRNPWSLWVCCVHVSPPFIRPRGTEPLRSSRPLHLVHPRRSGCAPAETTPKNLDPPLYTMFRMDTVYRPTLLDVPVTVGVTVPTCSSDTPRRPSGCPLSVRSTTPHPPFVTGKTSIEERIGLCQGPKG